MVNKKIRDGKFTLRNATVADTSQLEELQFICFPSLSWDELLTKEHFANHVHLFGDGQLVITDGDTVIASSSTFRTSYPKEDHTFLEFTDNLWLTNAHKPDGDWLYQFDIGVLPEYRGRKLSIELYNAQQEMVKALGMKGQVTVGMTSGYIHHKEKYSIEEYCEKVKADELTDPTIAAQRKAGFQWVKPIFNYVDDPLAGNCGVMMVWEV